MLASTTAIAQDAMFQLRSSEFLQLGSSVSNLAWRADGEGGLDATNPPCEGRFVLGFTDRKPTPFHVGSLHTFLHRVELSGYVFDSDNMDPLVFRVDGTGYTYVRGKGTVKIIPAGDVVVNGVKVLEDGRTFLLPPGRTNAAITPIPKVSAGAPFSVCGRQIRIISLARTSQGTEDVLILRML